MNQRLGFVLLLLGTATSAFAQDRPKIGETITTESGLVYKFTKLGNGPKPESYEMALKLNPKKTAAEVRDHETATTALAALR